MCGIVAGVSYRNIVPILTEGLRRMEYRGYDSCGVAVVDDGQLKRSRTVKRVQDLIRQTEEDEVKGSTGIAHTRWATHGAPEIRNTHPLFSNNQIAVVHNGIIENYAAIKEELIGKGYEFVSQTDTEVIAHLVHYYYKGDLLGAVENVLRRIRGAFALAISCKDEPGRIVAARVAAPLVIALGENENFVASDPMALAGVTDRYIYLEDGDVADVRQQSARAISLSALSVPSRLFKVSARTLRSDRTRITCRRKSLSSLRRFPIPWKVLSVFPALSSDMKRPPCLSASNAS